MSTAAGRSRCVGLLAGVLTLGLWAACACAEEPVPPAAGADLMKAARTGDTARAKAILAADPSLANFSEENGGRPPGEAVRFGYRDIVRALLDAGADMTVPDSVGRRPLLSALDCGHAEIAAMLEARGAVLAEKGDIYDAAYHGDLARVKKIMEASPDAMGSHEGKFRLTPLLAAVLGDRCEVAEWLLRKGADPNDLDYWGRTPLFVAVGSKEMTELLLMWDAETDIENGNRETSLHAAARRGTREVAERLLGRGAKVDARTNDGRTPLYDAADVGNTAVADLLIAKGADAEPRANSGMTPLQVAANSGHAAMVDLLVARGAKVESRGGSAWTPLGLAVSNGHKDAAARLVALGAKVDTKDGFGWTPMHDAARFGRMNMIEWLIAQGASVAVADNNGVTPLHLAAESGFREVIGLLLDKGAPVNARTKSGLTPVGSALKAKRNETAEFLKSRGGQE